MKHQTKSKTHSKTKTHTKTTSRTTTHTPHTPSHTETESIPRQSLTLNTSLKSCQEVEVGDIGGFGSTRELEEHQKRCSEPATEFCSNCGRSLCRNHYDMIHRDHDGLSRHSTGSTLA
ncbi:MAG TPA: hypothetical protein VE955_11870 [Candidatus Dormibacteraeota bacterium]|nr:hypothetical protein [Candidatus Dormibacteraeota bacterium]